MEPNFSPPVLNLPKPLIGQASCPLFQTRHQGSLSLITTGFELMKKIKNDLLCATSSIDMLFYIIRNDAYGDTIVDLLIQKAQEGVRVRLLLDWIGSIFFHRKTIERLKKGGVQFSYSNRTVRAINKRNHRKITVIDDTIGYLGGFNIGKEYVSQIATYGYWRDFHLRLEGDGALTLKAQFLYDWYKATKKQDTYDIKYPNLKKGNLHFTLIGTNGSHVENVYLTLFEQAKSEIMIATPYFIPTNRLLGALLHACKRGIRVILIVPYRNDHPLVGEAANFYFRPLLKSGATIYRFIPGFFHTKATVIDRTLCDVGTSNFDLRSFFLNEEMNCIIEDASFTQQVVYALHQDILFSEPLTLEAISRLSLLQKGKEKFALFLRRHL